MDIEVSLPAIETILNLAAPAAQEVERATPSPTREHQYPYGELPGSVIEALRKPSYLYGDRYLVRLSDADRTALVEWCRRVAEQSEQQAPQNRATVETLRDVVQIIGRTST